jgi:hypothetical protein
MNDQEKSFYTHQEFLDFYLKHTEGDILELGVGLGSTSITSKYASKNRILISVDNDHTWIEKTKETYPESDYHKYVYTENWLDVIQNFANHKWSVIFVDQKPWSARALSYYILKNSTDYMLIHDVDYFTVEKVFGRFKKSDNYLDCIYKNEKGEPLDIDFSQEFKHWKLYYPEKPWPYHTGPPTLVGTNKDNFIEYKK